MKYFKVTYVSQKTLHPEGYKTFHAFVEAETKHTAKLKALEVLAQKDSDYRMMYKVPRLEDIGESEYIKQTEIQSDRVDEVSTARYCALLSLFGEDEEYGDDERRDADELMTSPDEEQEAYARYDALCERVYEALPDDATEEVMQALAKRLWADMKAVSPVAQAVEAESLNLQAKPGLLTESVDNTGDSGEISSDINRSPDATPLVENAPDNDDRISQSVREYPHDFATLELEIACALWPHDVEADAVPGEVLRWAKDKVKRRDEDLIGWLCALRKVPDILSRSREFVFKVIRTPHDQDIYLTPEAIAAYVARFVEPETTVASETADVPDIAEPETVDAEATESEIHYSPEEDMPAFLRDLKPVNGAVEDGRLFATVDALNARLTDIPAGCSLVLWGLDNALYHAADGYSSTQLRLLQSGGTASLDWYRDAPCLDEASPCLTLGSALHTALLEPERFAADYLCTPSVNLRTSEGKAQKAEFLQQCREENKTALPETDYRRVCMMRDSAWANPTVRALLQRGIAELSVYHRPAFEDRGEIRLVYAFARMTSGEIVVEVMTRADVDRVRDTVKSASYAASPWMKWYDRMALKTVLHRIARRLPCASELFSLLEAGNGIPATEQARSEPHRHPVRRGLREVLSRCVLPAEQETPLPAPCPATEERAEAPVSDEFDALMIALDDVTDEQNYRPVAERCKTLAQTLTAEHRDALREKVKRTKGRLEKTRREAYTHAENQTPVALAEGDPEPARPPLNIIPLANSSGTAWRFPNNTVETDYFQAQQRAAAMGCQLQPRQARRFSASH